MMGVFGLAGRLSCVLLLSQVVWSIPLKGGKQITPEEAGCLTYDVDQHHPIQRVTMDDSLTFLVQPSHPSLALDIAVSHKEMYQAVVKGTMIKLEKCNMDRSDCETIDEGATKSSDLLDTTAQNIVNVTLDQDGQISVSVGLKQNVMGNLMAVDWDEQSQHSNVKVSLRPMPSIPGYSIKATVLCNDTYKPLYEQVPLEPSLATVVPEPKDPFPRCAVYEVKQDQPLGALKLDNSLMIAVFPSEPSLHLNISLKEEMYQATIDGSMTRLLKCPKSATHCEMMNEGGVKASDTLAANQWNYVNISLIENKVTVQVNQKLNVMQEAMGVNHGNQHATVTVVATNGISNSTHEDTEYNVRVNVQCDEDMADTTISSTTINTHDKAAPIGGDELTTTESPAPKESSGSNPWRVVAIVLAVICAILLAVFLFRCLSSKYRGNMKPGEHSRLQDMQQQQQ